MDLNMILKYTTVLRHTVVPFMLCMFTLYNLFFFLKVKECAGIDRIHNIIAGESSAQKMHGEVKIPLFAPSHLSTASMFLSVLGLYEHTHTHVEHTVHTPVLPPPTRSRRPRWGVCRSSSVSAARSALARPTR